MLDEMSREPLGNFELLVLLAVMRLRDEAYGVPIAELLEQALGRNVAGASVYAALARLAKKGLVRSRLGDQTAERGGRAKRFFSITPEGLQEVKTAKSALTVLWRGLPDLRGQLA
jgi:PadR family transcriptional regulator, regulatory protein PadR